MVDIKPCIETRAGTERYGGDEGYTGKSSGLAALDLAIIEDKDHDPGHENLDRVKGQVV